MPLALIAGVLAIVAGFVTIGVAWHLMGQTDQLWIQNQRMLTGGITGLGLIIVGVGLALWDRSYAHQRALARHLSAIATPAEIPAPTDLTDPEISAPTAPRRRRSAPVTPADAPPPSRRAPARKAAAKSTAGRSRSSRT